MHARYTPLLIVGLVLISLNWLTYIMHWPKHLWLQSGYLIIAVIHSLQLLTKHKKLINTLISIGLIIWAISNLLFWNITSHNRAIFHLIANAGLVIAFLAWFYNYLQLGDIKTKNARRVANTIYTCGGIACSTGIVLKTIHWPGGKSLMIIGVILFSVVIGIWLFTPSRVNED